MAKYAERMDVRIDRQGRVVVPRALRRALSLDPAQALVARVEEGQLIIETRENVLARLKGRFAKVPRNVNLADELIAERRKEGDRE